MFASSTFLHAQSPTPPTPPSATPQALPNVPPQNGSSGTDSGFQPNSTSPGQTTASGSPYRSRPSNSTPFKIPRSISETTSSGIKFQLALPRMSLGTGHQMGGGQLSPLDSNGMQGMGGATQGIGAGSPMFPSSGSFGRSTDAASSGMFSTPSNGLARGGGNSAGGLNVSVPAKSSMFDVHLSMQNLMGGSFSENAEGGGSSSASGAGDFGNAGGLRGAGAGEGGKGSGAKLSMGLRF